MTILKCKICGGDVQAESSATYGTCDSCGSMTTLPKASDERKANLFNRANHFRRKNEFDKAMQAYESILNEDDTDAEAHWGFVLARYGIEYVEDPVSHEYIPTCHRVQSDPILADLDYVAALEHSPDSYTKELYKQEARRIAEIQKEILAVSATNEPYDIFICYKETTSGGSRTKDSTIAQDIYSSLIKEGYKVFFARITLEKILGQAYEPYIFSALNSARVMLVVGTSAENFNAIWVRNEWTRFLMLKKKDGGKLLIPCFRDMDVYDLPEELSSFQSQDVSKIGFLQDLLHGVKKVLSSEKTEKTPQSGVEGGLKTAAPGVASLVKRGYLFIEDGEWNQADEYFDRVLDIDPEYAPAYIGKLLAKLRITSEAALSGHDRPLAEMPDYKKAVRFANPDYRSKLEEYAQEAQERAEEIKRQAVEKALRLEEEKRKLAEEQEQKESQIKAQSEHEKKIRCKEILIATREKVNKVLIYEASCKEHCLSEQFNEIQERFVDATEALEEVCSVNAEAQELLEQCKEKIRFLDQQKKWAYDDRCVHCGGELSFFLTKCYECGKRNILT